MKVGDKVSITKEANYYWTGVGTVVELFALRRNDQWLVDYAMVLMESGRCIGQKGAFLASELEVVSQPLEIVGGAPHGFGVWVEGKFHPVDIGALGKVITDLQSSAREKTPLFEKFEDWFDIWDTTKNPEIRRYCKIAWQVASLSKVS